jgi:catechol 2,3-dioxygenase-like lactoylglutathione lyase family enzyme
MSRWAARIVLAISLLGNLGAVAQTPQPRTEKAAFTATGAFVAFVVTDVDASVRWYETNLGLHETKRGRSPRVAAETVILGGPGIFVELSHYTDRILAKRHIDDTAPVAGPVKAGAIVSAEDFDSLIDRFRQHGSNPGVFQDAQMKVRSFIIADNDGNLLQFFAALDRG